MKLHTKGNKSTRSGRKRVQMHQSHNNGTTGTLKNWRRISAAFLVWQRKLATNMVAAYSCFFFQWQPAHHSVEILFVSTQVSFIFILFALVLHFSYRAKELISILHDESRFFQTPLNAGLPSGMKTVLQLRLFHASEFARIRWMQAKAHKLSYVEELISAQHNSNAATAMSRAHEEWKCAQYNLKIGSEPIVRLEIWGIGQKRFS